MSVLLSLRLDDHKYTKSLKDFLIRVMHENRNTLSGRDRPDIQK